MSLSELSLLARLRRLAAEAEVDGRTLALVAALALVWLGLEIASRGLFLTPRNLYNLAVQSSVVGVMASGMVLVITARHIDLSVGSVLGFTGMAIAVLQTQWLPLGNPATAPLSIVAGLGLGATIGAFQGWWVAYRRVPAFVVTLAGLLAFRGAAYLLSDGQTLAPLASGHQVLGGGLQGSIGGLASWLLAGLFIAASTLVVLRGRARRVEHGFEARPAWADALRITAAGAATVAFVVAMNAHVRPHTGLARGVPVPVLLWIASVVLLTVVLRQTRFGRYVYAIGGNSQAAVLAGVDIRRVSLGVFVWMGVLAAVAAVITTARLGAGTNSMGTLAELSVIAAAVIGGTSLAGGRGSVPGAVLGALIMQSLENGMLLLGVSSASRQIAIGALLVAAVWLDVATRRDERSS